MMAGDFYDIHFHLYQSLVSAILLYAVLKLSDEWWTKEFGALCVIQILHNFGDILFPGGSYNEIQATLNILEAIIIFGAGGITQLLRMLTHGQSNHRGNSGNRSLSTAHGPQGRKDGV